MSSGKPIVNHHFSNDALLSYFFAEHCPLLYICSFTENLFISFFKMYLFFSSGPRCIHGCICILLCVYRILYWYKIVILIVNVCAIMLLHTYMHFIRMNICALVSIMHQVWNCMDTLFHLHIYICVHVHSSSCACMIVEKNIVFVYKF